MLKKLFYFLVFVLCAQIKRAKVPDSLAQMCIIGLDNAWQNSD